MRSHVQSSPTFTRFGHDGSLNTYTLRHRNQVDVIETGEDGEDHPLAVLGAGDFFGEMAMLEGGPLTRWPR